MRFPELGSPCIPAEYADKRVLQCSGFALKGYTAESFLASMQEDLNGDTLNPKPLVSGQRVAGIEGVSGLAAKGEGLGCCVEALEHRS